MAMLLARTSMRRVPSKTVGVQRRFLNNGTPTRPCLVGEQHMPQRRSA
jgi:hypothetical protein